LPQISLSEDVDIFLVSLPQGGEEPLTKEEIKLRIREGRLTDGDLIWNEEEKEWKPARTFSWLKKTAVLPTASVIEEIRNRSVIQSKAMANVIHHDMEVRKNENPDQPRPKTHAFVARPAPRSTIPHTTTQEPSQPKVFVKIQAKSDSTPPPTEKVELEVPKQEIDKEENILPEIILPKVGRPRKSIFKWVMMSSPIVCAMGVFIFNWWTIQHPVSFTFQRFQLNSMTNPSVHYQFYINPNILIVNFPEFTKTTSPGNLIDIVTVLAKLKSRSWTGNIFEFVELQKGGNTIYRIKGFSWNHLVDLYDQSSETRASFIIKNLNMPDGSPVLYEPSDDPVKELGQKQKSFSDFSKRFISTPVPEDYFKDIPLHD
jgi:hypothetical protein